MAAHNHKEKRREKEKKDGKKERKIEKKSRGGPEVVFCADVMFGLFDG
jgi:hypothetical protein